MTSEPRAATHVERFDEQVYRLCRSIPRGRVCTYGGLAGAIPAPPDIDPLAYRNIRARWVGYALGRAPQDVPWHRVLNARGEISPRPGIGPGLQRRLLEAEGVRFAADGRIDLARYGWLPEPPATIQGEEKRR